MKRMINMNYFWSNTVWYLLLDICTIIELAYILIKSKKNWLPMLALYLSIAGATYCAEMTVFAFMKAYDYYPMIFNQVSRYDDGLAGNIFSQFSVSASLLLVAFLNLRFFWQVLIACAYGGIEMLFLYLGIYSQNWYRTWMTVAGLLVLFFIVKIVYKKTFDHPGNVFKYFLISFAVYVPYTHLIIWPFKLLGYPAYSESLLPDPVISVAVVFLTNLLIVTNAVMLSYLKRLKWFWHAAVVFSLFSLFYMEKQLHVVIYQDFGTLFLFVTAQIIGTYASVFLVDWLFNRAEKWRKESKPIHSV